MRPRPSCCSTRCGHVGLGRDGLVRLAAQIGSDVPALLLGEPAYCRGRGEVVEPVLLQTTTWVVKPFAFGVSSADAYGWWDDAAATGPDPGALIAAAEAGNNELLGSALFNDLEGPVAAHHPEISETIAAFIEAGARGALMSGSGPTVVALCSFASAQDVADAVPGSFVVDAPPRASHACQNRRRSLRGGLTARHGPLEPGMEVRLLPPEPGNRALAHVAGQSGRAFCPCSLRPGA